MRKLFAGLTVIALSLVTATGFAQQSTPANSKPAKPRTISRLFWQDTDSVTVRWGDVSRGEQWELKAAEIAGFPKLDAQQVSFVQMQAVEGTLVTGVHDHDDGDVQSGWIAIQSGVEQEAHGDHFHWRFKDQPQVKAVVLDKQQGNPAHVYVYENKFYLANDKKNGFTVLDTSKLPTGKVSAQFFEGGGGHITLAAVNNQVAYATWIDREGDNLGRVDVVPLNRDEANGYSIRLPSGGLHGATANSGKVFFAPSDGICWVTADTTLSQPAGTSSINHIALGKDANDKPLRTGAFANHLNWVLCVTGTGAEASLCMLDAQAPKPALTKFALSLEAGASVTTPVATVTPKGKHYAFVFQESKDQSQPEKLIVLDLDSNQDRQLGDVSIAQTIEVGASRIEGHSGHHEVTVTPSHRYAFITNPGDGEIWVLALDSLSIQARLKVGGTPTHLSAIGG